MKYMRQYSYTNFGTFFGPPGMWAKLLVVLELLVVVGVVVMGWLLWNRPGWH